MTKVQSDSKETNTTGQPDEAQAKVNSLLQKRASVNEKTHDIIKCQAQIKSSIRQGSLATQKRSIRTLNKSVYDTMTITQSPVKANNDKILSPGAQISFVKTPSQFKKYVLVLDLDETLVHYKETGYSIP